MDGAVITGTALPVEYVVAGSGAGGSAVARGLAEAGRSVIVLERGRPVERMGGLAAALRMYDPVSALAPSRSVRPHGAVPVYRAVTAGGSTVVSCGNAVPALASELASMGIDLEDDLRAVSDHMGVAPLASKCLSDGTTGIQAAAASLGLEFRPMPKALPGRSCAHCGSCLLGCRRDRKWTARATLANALRAGAEIRYGSRVDRVVHAGGRVIGVEVQSGRATTFVPAERVILAAGGVGTPAILRRSGVETAGRHLFVDIFQTTFGVLSRGSSAPEPLMSLVCDQTLAQEGFILSPFLPASRTERFLAGGARAARIPRGRGIGLMTKIRDESAGFVDEHEAIQKPVTPADHAKLDTGDALARRILAAAGAREDSLFTSRPQGAHPGGSAAAGSVVDTDLQTEIEGLYVCDASVLPQSPGSPPMLTIAALGRWLARRLNGGERRSGSAL